MCVAVKTAFLVKKKLQRGIVYFFAAFLGDFFAAFFAGFLAAFFAGFLAAGFLAAGFLAFFADEAFLAGFLAAFLGVVAFCPPWLDLRADMLDAFVCMCRRRSSFHSSLKGA